MVRVLRSPVDAISCALFPASCCACGSPLVELSRAPVCDPCWNSLATHSAVCCHLCGEDLGISASAPNHSDKAGAQTCHLCSKAPPPFRRAVAFGVYRETLRSLIHSLKYDGMSPIAEGLGTRLARATLSLHGEAADLLVVPVPLHRSKRTRRQFNHAGLIAQAAVRELRLHRPEWKLTLAPGLLERKRVTESQAGLTPHQRRVNVRGAFRATQPATLRDRQVLLIDDIYTTGATARACSKALLLGGAASVWVATVARAQYEHPPAIQFRQIEEPEEQRLSELPGVPMHEDVAFWDTSTATSARQVTH